MNPKTPRPRSARSPRELPVPHVVSGERAPCVWMEAGVLTWWICDRDFECAACPLDAALRHTGSTAPVQTTDVTAPPQRTHNDLVYRPIEDLDARALYARTHVWVREETNGLVRIGLDAFAAWVIGRLRCVVLVPAGTRVTRNEPCAWLDQPGGTLTIRSPISGQVVETNAALGRRSDLELCDVFGSEWLLRLRPWRLESESKRLVDATEFAHGVAENVRVWQRMLRKAMQAGSAQAGPSLPDGGVAVSGLDELLGARRHTRIAAGFLRGSRSPQRD